MARKKTTSADHGVSLDTPPVITVIDPRGLQGQFDEIEAVAAEACKTLNMLAALVSMAASAGNANGLTSEEVGHLDEAVSTLVFDATESLHNAFGLAVADAARTLSGPLPMSNAMQDVFDAALDTAARQDTPPTFVMRAWANASGAKRAEIVARVLTCTREAGAR